MKKEIKNNKKTKKLNKNVRNWMVLAALICLVLFLVGYAYYSGLKGECSSPVDAFAILGCIIILPLIAILTSVALFFVIKAVTPGRKNWPALITIFLNILLLLIIS